MPRSDNWTAVHNHLLDNYQSMGWSHGKLMLLIILCRHIHRTTMKVEMKIPMLAKAVGIHERTARTYLKELRETGWVETIFHSRHNEFDLTPMFSKLGEPLPTASDSQQGNLLCAPDSQQAPLLCAQDSQQDPLPCVPDSQQTQLHTDAPARTRDPSSTHSELINHPSGSASRPADQLEDLSSVMRGAAQGTVIARRNRTQRRASRPLTPSREQGCLSTRLKVADASPCPTGPAENAHGLWEVFSGLWRKRWPIVSCKSWTARERKHAKDLIAEYSWEQAVATLEMMFSEWNSIKKEYKLQGFPSMGMVYGYRGSFVPRAVVGEEPAAQAGPAQYDPRFDGSEKAGGWE